MPLVTPLLMRLAPAALLAAPPYVHSHKPAAGQGIDVRAQAPGACPVLHRNGKGARMLLYE